jgi:hypothetical protein
MKKKSQLPAPLPSLYTPCLHLRWLIHLLLVESSNDRVLRFLASDNLPCPSGHNLDAVTSCHGYPLQRSDSIALDYARTAWTPGTA